MVALPAVEPDGFGVFDGYGEGASGGGVGCWDEGGEEAVFEGVAGVCEGALCYGVVLRDVRFSRRGFIGGDTTHLWEERKLDVGANFGSYVVWRVDESTLADCHLDRSTFLRGSSSYHGSKGDES